MAFGTPPTRETTPVQVALRIRPLTSQDRAQPRFSQSTESDVIKTIDNTVVIVPHQKSFTFDHVFGTDSTQEQVFGSVASGMVDRFIDGYNVTILAYGQTSSGKTYTMGTEVRDQSDPKHQGIIPRAMAAIFDHLNCDTTIKPKQRPGSLSPSPKGLGNNKRSMMMMRPTSMTAPHINRSSSSTNVSQRAANLIDDPQTPQQQRRYTIKVSFIEIYNEELIDLLNPAPQYERPPVTIREDPKGQIYWTGVREVSVENTEDVLRYLQMGTCNRATGSTDMNAKSSRSHAIFSVTLRQEKWVAAPKASMSTTVQQQHLPRDTPTPTSSRSTMPGVSRRRASGVNGKGMAQEFQQQQQQQPDPSGEGKWVVSNSKFHFVDLAGSERLKRTAAEGDRRKEGININAGLLALGNVISALADAGSKRSAHIPYRDSKLTRLLQDSLGGNATTLMIACISPAEINLVETANTVKYAHRARHIKNKAERNEAEEWLTNDNPEFLRAMIIKLKDQVRTLRTPSLLMTPPSPRTPSFSTDTATTPTCSSSATTNITVPDDMDIVGDLRRQIEELQQQVQEKRDLLEKQQQPPSLADVDFQHLVEPVIEEYEKSVSSLESQLAMARAALAHQDEALHAQAAQLASLQEQQAQKDADGGRLEAMKQEAEQLKAESAQRQVTITELEAAVEAMKEQELCLRDELKRQEHSFQDVMKQQDQILRDELQRTEQVALRWRLDDLDKAHQKVATLLKIQEKQDQIISAFDAKMEAMEGVILELNQQLAERANQISELNRALVSLHADRAVIEEHTQQLVESLEKQTERADMAWTALNELQNNTDHEVQHVREKLAVAHEAALAKLKAESAHIMEALQTELAETRQSNHDQIQTIEFLETSLEAIQAQLDEATASHAQKSDLIRSLQEQLNSCRRLTIDTESSHDSGLPDEDKDKCDLLSPVATHFGYDNDLSKGTNTTLRERFRRSLATAEGQEEVLDKLIQTMSENSQLSVQVNDLEAQMELQHNQFTLENKSLELKVMKLAAANERLEKEATSIISRSLSSHQLEHNGSPPQTPRSSSMSPFIPLHPSPLSSLQQQQQQQLGLQQDQKLIERDCWSLFNLKQSGSQRSMTMFQQQQGDDIITPALAIGASPHPHAAIFRRVRAQSAALVPPPSAPPSNPLPPVPSPARSFSTPLLTSTTASISDMITSSSGHFSAEQYEKIIRSLQRKVKVADEDVRAHQQVISKLETQLARSENSVRHVEQQLETAEQEKQTYMLEIEHLRAHEAEHGEQEQQLLQDLAEQRMLKDKAEKARHILEDRMEELLRNSKRSKFMCF